MNYTFEMNNAQDSALLASGKVKANSPVVEIFTAMVNGEDLSKYGKKADIAANYIKELGNKASIGDASAIAELNEIRKFSMQPRLLQEMKLLGVFGSYQALGWNDVPELEKMEVYNARADIQAEGLDVSTPFFRRTKEALSPITISAGHKVNYREIALGNMYNESLLVGEVHKAMRNKATTYVIETVFKAIANATGIKYFYENAGLVKADVDALLTKIRRYGRPNVLGDYAVLAQFIPWAGYVGSISQKDIIGISQKVLDEIVDTGLIGKYNGAILSEFENTYDFNKVNAAGDNYETILPAGLAFVTPAAPAQGVAPIQIFSVGGLTSLSGNDVTTGELLTRFDMRIACGVANTDAIGIIHDTQLDSLTH